METETLYLDNVDMQGLSTQREGLMSLFNGLCYNEHYSVTEEEFRALEGIINLLNSVEEEKQSPTKKYTVVLSYPDYVISSDYGGEYYTAHVEAGSPEEAVALAQAQAAEENECDTPQDFLVVFVGKGFQVSLLPAGGSDDIITLGN